MADGMTPTTGSGGGFMSSLMETLSKPGTQQLMANLGTELDPHGAGGVIGRPTSKYITAQQQGQMFKELMKALGKGGKIKQAPDGTTEIQAGEVPQGEETSQTEGTSQLRESQAAKAEQQSLGVGTQLSMVDLIYQQLFGGE